MTSEIEAFRIQLRAAGQPWSRRGVWCVGGGMLLLAFLLTVLLSEVPLPKLLMSATVPLAGVSMLLLATGWVFLIMAILKRRRWAKAQDLAMPALSEASEGVSR